MTTRAQERAKPTSWIPERDRGPAKELLERARTMDPPTFWKWARDKGLTEQEAYSLLWWCEHGNRFHERPVPVRQFLFSRNYMRALDETGEPVIWPKLVDVIEKVCTGGYVESIWTGSIGTGKTTAALYAQAYKLYELLCLWSPHATYGLDPTSEIEIVFQSLNKELAASVNYERFRAMIDRAPIFSTMEFKYDRDFKSEMRFANRVIVKPVAGVESGALGQNVIGAQIDEISSMAKIEGSKRARDKEAYDQAVALYTAIVRRRESRFLDQGELPGLLCLSGSKIYPDDFLHEKLAEARDNPKRIFVFDEVLWNVKPWAYGKKRFRVFVGDTTRKPRIMEEGERLGDDDDVLIRKIPVEFRPAFERDLLGALRDIAGFASLSIHPFILNRDALADCFGKATSVGSRGDVDFESTKLRIFPSRWEGTERYPRYVHLDLALTADSAGLSIAHVRGFKRLKRSEMVDEILPLIRYDLVLEITPPKGGEIQFEKIRRLLYLLREHGMPIKWVSADSFQSSDMLQILSAKGFIVGQESVDKNPGVYEIFKTAIYDGRVEVPEHPRAFAELIRLERDPKGHVDHPPGGSKDISDAMASCAFGLSLQTEIWTMFGIDLSHVPETLLQQADRVNKHDMEGKVA